MTDDSIAAFDIENDDEGITLGCDPFETQELLDAVDAIDRLRGFLNDDPNGGPPQLRSDLLRLHQRAMHVVDYQVERSEKERFFDEAVDLSDQVGEMAELIGRIEATLHRLTDMSPEIEDD